MGDGARLEHATVNVIKLDASHAVPARSSPSKIGREEGWSFLPDSWCIRRAVLWE